MLHQSMSTCRVFIYLNFLLKTKEPSHTPLMLRRCNNQTHLPAPIKSDLVEGPHNPILGGTDLVEGPHNPVLGGTGLEQEAGGRQCPSEEVEGDSHLHPWLEVGRDTVEALHLVRGELEAHNH